MSKRSLTGEVGKSLKRTVMALVALAGMAFALPAHSADVNVLIIGSENDSSDFCNVSGTWERTQPFSPAKVKTNLKNILEGASLGSVNVQLIDRGYRNLAHWFHNPKPEGEDRTTRWPNLRGEGGTVWDYIVLIGDSSSIEYLPGFYAHGVGMVSDEIAKGSAETVLLMPWPSADSTSTLEHYKEIVYRTGRSGGFKVAPAGLAWQGALDAGEVTAGSEHPNDDGAYIAAATIFSRIWGQNEVISSYNPKPALTTIVNDTVNNNVGAQQYTGKFNNASIFTFKNEHQRQWQVSSPGSSTPTMTGKDMVQVMKGSGVVNNSVDPKMLISFMPLWYTKVQPGFAHQYYNYFPGNDNTTTSVEMLSDDTYPGLDEDLKEAHTRLAEYNSLSENLRFVPLLYMWAEMYQLYPYQNPITGQHFTPDGVRMINSYMFTMFTGRCPVFTTLPEMTREAEMIGYKTAWRMGHCQTRAPGFRVTPSSALKTGVNDTTGEDMTVQFVLPPRKDVTVNISLSDTSMGTLDKQTMTFTPENYDTPQTVFLLAKPDAVHGTTFNVLFDTVSDDVVYDGLNDSWEYVVNSTPDASPSAPDSPLTLANGAVSVTTTLYANGTDGDGDPLSYTWSKADGPEGMSFSSPTAENPTATFYEIGTYILECGVTDGYEPITRTLRVDVLPETLVLRPADNPANTDDSDTNHGVRYELYEGNGLKTVDELTEFGEPGLNASGNGGIPIDTGFISYFRFGGLYDGDGEFGCIYHSYVDVPRDGLYTFSLRSNDGSQLKIGDTIVVDNDSFYEPYGNASGVIGLERGKHEITVKFFFRNGGDPSLTPDLYVSWAGPDLEQQQIHWDALSSVMPYDVPDAPIAYDQDVATPPDTALDITLTATDADGDGLTYEVVSQPTNGTFISGTAPNLRYLPNASFIGTDSFTFTATDDSAGALTSTPATVTIKVNTLTAPEVIAAASPTTVELTEGTGGTPVAGAYFEWNASTDTDGDNTWESTGTTAYDWAFNAGTLAPVAIFDARFSSLTAAYEFPAAKSTGSTSFNDFGRDKPATFECVIDVDGSDGTIFETGNYFQGVVIDVKGGVLRGTVAAAPRDVRVAYTLTPTDMGRFIHVVLVLDAWNDVIQLYVDGELKDERPRGGNIWTNKNPAGLGAVSVGFVDGASEADFTGKMALFRFYSNTAFSAADVTANFNAINTGWAGTATMDGTVTDADGDSCATTWTLESGPAGAVVDFDDASAEDTTAIFYTLGTYVLRLTADDGIYTVSNEVTVTVTDGSGTPVAYAGEPQTLTDTDEDGSEDVTLNGGGSLDPDGTITNYVWSEGGSPIANSATSTVSLAVGTHTITLMVTDNDGLTNADTVEITVNALNHAPVVTAAANPMIVALGEGTGGSTPVAGAYYEWSASTDTDGDNTWESTGTTAYDWAFDSGALTPVAIADARFTLLTAAYEFPAAKDASNSAFQGDGDQEPATFECVIDVDGSDGSIFKTGGSGDGMQIDVSSGVLRGTVEEDPTEARVAYTLTPTDMGRFIHVVFVADNVNDVVQLYVDGELKDSQPWTGPDWSGSDDGSLGSVSGTIPDGGSTADFTGKIALFRYYRNTAFSAADVTENFNAINTGPAATVTLGGSATDADGVTPTTTWTKASGPGQVVFDDASAVDTTAIFYTLGTYVLRLTADDGIYTVSDEVTITVQTAEFDSDSDGMEDAWELTHFGSLTSTAGLASEDQDNDGFPDLHEYLAGTDPTNGLSRLVITAGSLGEGPNKFVWSWQAVSNKTYTILSKESLLDPNWTTNAAAIPGVEPMCVHTVLVTGAESFFMLKLEP